MSFIRLDKPSDGGVSDDYPGVDQRSCRLFGPTALIVQGLMGVLVILSLVYKRHRETIKRPWRIWLFDVSKQVAGQMFVHGVNVLISDVVAHRIAGNACVFYFLNILIDTTLGVALIYLILHVLTFILSDKLHLKGFESGQYGSPPSINYWARQAAVYVLSLTTMKLLVVGLFALFPGIFKIGEWLLSWTRTGSDEDYVEVIFTMGLFPITMNVLQFWLIDSIVKASTNPSVSLPTDSPRQSYGNDQDREPLFHASSDDEDDDAHGRPPHDIENPPPRDSDEFPDKDAETRSSSMGVDEHKAASGSSTPGAPTEVDAQSVAMHAYPPSISSSPSSSYISPSRTTSTSPRRKPLRKSKPPPLHLRPNSQPAVNSPQLSHPHSQSKPQAQPQSVTQLSRQDEGTQEWASSWEDSEDWAHKVGEEDWTGNRMEEKRGAVSEIWESHSLTPGS